jgi:hypothetical protein
MRYKYGERTSSTVSTDRHFGFQQLESRDFCPESPEVASCDKEYRGVRNLGTSDVEIQRRQFFGKRSCGVPKLGMRDTWQNHKVGPAWLIGGHALPGGKESTLHLLLMSRGFAG